MMTNNPNRFRRTFSWALALGLTIPAGAALADAGSSTYVEWTCQPDGVNCPWGSTTGNPAIVWPASTGAITNRFDYTTSGAIYLPASIANGAIIWIDSGYAGLFAGQPNGSHRVLGWVYAGDYFTVSGLAAGEVLSVQSEGDFTYQFDLTPTTPPPGGGNDPPEDPQDPPPGTPTSLSSKNAVWNCTSSPCPWGDSTSNPAIAWPAGTDASNLRYGYTVTDNIYLNATQANGTVVRIDSGYASLYVGQPMTGSHRLLTTLWQGDSYTVSGVLAGEVLSVQGDSDFTYRVEVAAPSTPPDGGSGGSGGGDDGEIVHAVQGEWRCDTDDCSGEIWYTAALTWPAGTAYQSNSRTDGKSRSAFTPDGQPLYPYMGAWADGCEVTAKTGIVLIIEWQRGTHEWRETWLNPGEKHTIHLVSPENGALIESEDDSPGFSVALKNCTPQPVP